MTYDKPLTGTPSEIMPNAFSQLATLHVQYGGDLLALTNYLVMREAMQGDFNTDEFAMYRKAYADLMLFLEVSYREARDRNSQLEGN